MKHLLIMLLLFSCGTQSNDELSNQSSTANRLDIANFNFHPVFNVDEVILACENVENSTLDETVVIATTTVGEVRIFRIDNKTQREKGVGMTIPDLDKLDRTRKGFSLETKYREILPENDDDGVLGLIPTPYVSKEYSLNYDRATGTTTYYNKVTVLTLLGFDVEEKTENYSNCWEPS